MRVVELDGGAVHECGLCGATFGDRRAVRALTRLAKFSDTERMAKLIDGVATLGGKEARAYLDFVAGGHPDADIRNLAREAIARSRRRRSGVR